MDLTSETQFEIQSEELKSLIRGKNTGLDTHYIYTMVLFPTKQTFTIFILIKNLEFNLNRITLSHRVFFSEFARSCEF